jgi:hypothetical protein
MPTGAMKLHTGGRAGHVDPAMSADTLVSFPARCCYGDMAPSLSPLRLVMAWQAVLYSREITVLFLFRMASSEMLFRVALVRTDVSEDLSTSIMRVTRIGELGTTLAVTSVASYF